MARAKPVVKEVKKSGSKKFVFGIVVLVVGLLYLLKDLKAGDYTMGIQPWTVVFVLAGLAFVWKGAKRIGM